MKRKMSASVVMLALGLVVSTAAACEKHAAAAAKKQAVKQVADKVTDAGTDQGATSVADKTLGSGKDFKKGGCNKNKAIAKLAASKAKGGCNKNKAIAKLTASKAKGDCNKPCNKKFKKVAGKDGGCPIAAKVETVLASLPKMEYRVGDEVSGCSKSAIAMAEKSDQPIQYLVGEDVFSDKDAAMVSLASLLEKEADTLQTMQFTVNGKCGRCPQRAKSIAAKTKSTVTYRVGGVDFDTKKDAETALASIREAVAATAMAYKVDGKPYKCSKKAGEKCKKAGKKLTYVVGEKETGCKTKAKLMLAEAKVRKIVETAVATSFSTS